MVRVLYGISPIGLGHATRSLVVTKLLRQEGAEVLVYSGRKVCDFFRANGEEAVELVSESGPLVFDGEMRWPSAWYLRSWLALRGDSRRTVRVMKDFAPDIVVGDEEFSGLQTAGPERKRVLISDELDLGFARSFVSARIERRVERWYKALQRSVDLLLVPDSGNDVGNIRHVGTIVREVKKTRQELMEEHSLPEGQMLLLSLSGSGIGSYLVDEVADAMAGSGVQGAYLVVTGNRDEVARRGVYPLGVVADNQDFVAAADLVISTAGKSTIDEAGSAGTPIITIPIRHHAEQERNALALGYSSKDRRNLATLIASKIGRREAPQASLGGQAASHLILSLM